MLPSIFNLEKRFNFNVNYNRLINLCDEEEFYTDGFMYPHNLWWVIDKNIKQWPYRGDACDYKQYFYDIGIDVYRGSIDNTKKMYILEFLLNITVFVMLKTLNNNVTQYKTVIDNIYYIIEKLNYSVYENEGKLSFTKRDADVDTTINTFKDNEDLRISLLSYNDFRISDNVNDKKQILLKLANWLEPQRSKFSSYNAALTKTVFSMLNKGGIRHQNEGQIEYKSVNEQLEAYDKLFKLILHLVRSEDIAEYQNYIKDLVES